MNIDKTSTTPLYIQIREDLKRSIVSGKLAPGERLPSVTALAAEKKVTAATIRRALQDLTDEGLIFSHVGRGTFVAGSPSSPDAIKPDGAEGSRGKPSGDDANRKREEASLRAARLLRQSVTRSLNEMMVLAQRPGIIAFTRGIGAPDMIEKGILTRLAQKALSGGEELFHDYGDPRGLLPLRTAIAALYAEQGLAVSPDQILVTSGSQQAIALLAQQAAENGRRVLCETPCYTGVSNAFGAFGLKIDTIQRTVDGPDISRLPAGGDLARRALLPLPGCSITRWELTFRTRSGAR